MNETIDLLTIDYSTDASGTSVVAITSRKMVFCQFKSVGMRETYQAMALNRSPSIVAVLADSRDYNDEQFASVGGKAYRVLRTYLSSGGIEITLEKTRDLDGVV